MSWFGLGDQEHFRVDNGQFANDWDSSYSTAHEAAMLEWSIAPGPQVPDSTFVLPEKPPFLADGIDNTYYSCPNVNEPPAGNCQSAYVCHYDFLGDPFCTENESVVSHSSKTWIRD